MKTYTVTVKVEHFVTHRVQADSIEDAMTATRKRCQANAHAVKNGKKQYSDFRVMEMPE